MKRLIRIAVAVAMLAAIAFAAPPVSADHDSPDGSNWPCNPGTDPACVAVGATNAYHEEKPDIAVAAFEDLCTVQGEIVPSGTPTLGGPQHTPIGIPVVNDDPAHSHYLFLDTGITCGDETLVVTSDGGNDGHVLDIWAGNCGPNGDCVELDPFDDCIQPGDPDMTLPGDCGADDAAGGDDHDWNDHHGSINESGWSNSSGYNGGRDDADGNREESNDCVAGAGTPGDNGDNANKANILVGTDPGWVKNIRVGVIIYAWGCVPGQPFAVFSSLLTIAPRVTPPSPFPDCILPGATAQCPLDITGFAHRSADWLIDLEPPT